MWTRRTTALSAAGLLPLAAILVGLPTYHLTPYIWRGAFAFSVAFQLFVLLFSRIPAARFRASTLPFVPLVAVYAASTLLSQDGFGDNVVTLFLVSTLFVFYAVHGARMLESRYFVRVALLLSLANFFVAILGFNQKNFDNGTAFYASCLVVFFLLRPRRNVLLAVTHLATLVGIAVLSNFRLLLVLAPVLYAAYFFFRTVQPRAISRRMVFFLVVGLIAGAFFGYLTLISSTYLWQVNQTVMAWTDRQITSGRQNIWPILLSTINQHPLFGLGADVEPSSYTNENLSAHNFYLQLTLQTGLVGLTALAWALLGVWSNLTSQRRVAPKVTFAAAVFLVFLLHNLTEVIMFQNAQIVSVGAWILIGLGTGRSLSLSQAQLRGRTLTCPPAVPSL